MITFPGGTGESQSPCPLSARAKSMNRRSASVPMSSTRTRSPTSRPSNPRISFPYTGGWNRRIEKCFRPYVHLILLILCRTWRDGRVDEGAQLEIVYPKRDRGFEFLSLRVPRFQRKGGTRCLYRRVRMIFNTPW